MIYTLKREDPEKLSCIGDTPSIVNCGGIENLENSKVAPCEAHLFHGGWEAVHQKARALLGHRLRQQVDHHLLSNGKVGAGGNF